MKFFTPNTLNMLKNKNEILLDTISGLKENILSGKVDESFFLNEYTESDLLEAQRHYEVFPELKGQAATLFDIKESLVKRGIKDNYLQDKIINVVLQTRLGLQFPLGSMLHKILLDNNIMLFISQNDTEIEVVTHKNRAEFKVKCLYSDTGQRPAISVDFTIDITPQNIVLTQFLVTQRSNQPAAKAAMSLFKSHQASLLERVINFFKRLFSQKQGFELENKDDGIFKIAVSEGELKMKTGGL